MIDPIVEYFGPIKLTYGFSSNVLCKHINKRIAPRLDQHASFEVNSKNNRICKNDGAAVDFFIEDEDMSEVIQWVKSHLVFDKIYFYGESLPIHISYNKNKNHNEIYKLIKNNNRLIPRKLIY